MNFSKMLQNNTLKNYLLIAFAFLVLLIIYFIFNNKAEQKSQNANSISYAECDHTKYATAPISVAKVLNDNNDAHLIHAQANGLKTFFATNDDFEMQKDSLLKNNLLLKLEDNDTYKIKPLRHSHPYLVPVAVEMVNEIARRFHKKLEDKEMTKYKFYLTSLLRTEETQRRLSRSNVNATNHTAHYYGTTIDISYKDFYDTQTGETVQNAKLVSLLTDVLVQMRKECKILAVRERKQACFHITVVACNPNIINE